jgi:hypothetical protein
LEPIERHQAVNDQGDFAKSALEASLVRKRGRDQEQRNDEKQSRHQSLRGPNQKPCVWVQIKQGCGGLGSVCGSRRRIQIAQHGGSSQRIDKRMKPAHVLEIYTHVELINQVSLPAVDAAARGQRQIEHCVSAQEPREPNWLFAKSKINKNARAAQKSNKPLS